VLGVFGLAWLPSEHVHSRTEDDHRVEFVHRHFESHHLLAVGARIDHDEDGEAQYLSSPFTVSKQTSQVYPVDQVVAAHVPADPSPVLVCWTLPSFATSGHDPPWGSSHGLRAPPAPLV
jgi:hypothetical protein